LVFLCSNTGWYWELLWQVEMASAFLPMVKTQSFPCNESHAKTILQLMDWKGKHLMMKFRKYPLTKKRPLIMIFFMVRSWNQNSRKNNRLCRISAFEILKEKMIWVLSKKIYLKLSIILTCYNLSLTREAKCVILKGIIWIAKFH
jgi:hypothetical protein